MCFQGRSKRKGRQILTPLQWKTDAEAKQQNLAQLYTVKYYVQSVHWTDSQGLRCFLLYIHSFISLGFKYRKLAGHCYVFHFSAFALHLSLHFLSGKQEVSRESDHRIIEWSGLERILRSSSNLPPMSRDTSH